MAAGAGIHRRRRAARRISAQRPLPQAVTRRNLGSPPRRQSSAGLVTCSSSPGETARNGGSALTRADMPIVLADIPNRRYACLMPPAARARQLSRLSQPGEAHYGEAHKYAYLPAHYFRHERALSSTRQAKSSNCAPVTATSADAGRRPRVRPRSCRSCPRTVTSRPCWSWAVNGLLGGVMTSLRPPALGSLAPRAPVGDDRRVPILISARRQSSPGAAVIGVTD